MSTTLPPCPKSPNCVSTKADPSDRVHYIEPLPLTVEVGAALDRLEEIVGAMPRARRIARGEAHIDFVFTTRLFRWKDDVRFVADAAESRIHFRSASRTGYGDLGVNRKRMESIRQAWERRGR